MSLKLLYLVYAFPPVNIVAAQRALFQAKYMAEAGARVTVICAEQTRKRDDPGLLKNLDGLPNLTVHRILPWGRDDQKGKDGFKPSAKGWLWVLRALKQALKLQEEEKFDVMLSTYGPRYPHLVASGIQRMTGLPWVAEYRDPWVGNEHQNRDTQFNRFLEKSIIKNASALVSASQGFAEILRNVHGEQKPIHVIYNGYVEIEQEPVEKDPGASGGLKLIIAGTVYPLQGKGVMELFKGMAAVKEKVTLDYYGPSEKLLKEILQQVDTTLLVNFHGRVSKNEVAHAIARADIGVLPASSVKGQLPVKFYDYLAAKKPTLMLAGKNSEIEQIMLETNSGVNAETAEEVVEFLDAIKTGSLIFSFENADFYTRKKQAVRLLQVLSEVDSQVSCI